MNLVSSPYGWSVFFGVPLLLWLIGVGAAFRKGRNVGIVTAKDFLDASAKLFEERLAGAPRGST
jgi:hypothetical protein